ncbi:FAD-dependent 5-carboxymethylaminomethyl-2-thiouridine(34) oxidoreductase MnmC [Marinobacter salicampi]|uniref:FAD-dependent 5-carboxymethylaminomethyl-2-thiouridine(34) oxidoreductase MnmC n=1 Tax=Marinobacter salicampi TaxID=435907 RepID=UPI00140A1020|nr:FAD-dependent 5-carboxymethylaminomethyl-2-thiouridine(34) oxidoreductase MnmC [Marinobacter salicampi]
MVTQEVIHAHGLTSRFKTLADGDHFVIAQEGFGAGLEFLLVWQTWAGAATENGRVLHFVAVEPFPLSPTDLAKIAEFWPELRSLSQELIGNYPPLTSGLHRLCFAGGRVKLSLYLGDPDPAWQDLAFNADAWFSACALSRQHHQGQPVLPVAAMISHCRTGATLFLDATTSAQTVEELEVAGFAFSPATGHEDRITGVLRPSAVPGRRPERPRKKIAIIGTGIAGALLARNLAERGHQVCVVDAGDKPGAAASGNRQGALYVKLGVDFNYQSRLALSALLHSQRFYRNCGAGYWHPTGLLQLAWSEQEADRQRRFCARNDYPSEVVRPVSIEEARKLSDFEVTRGGLWFPDGGWLEPAKICRLLLDHPGIHASYNYPVNRLMPCNGRWHISSNGHPEVVSDHVVLCAGHTTPALLPVAGHFRFKPIRGQVTSLPAVDIKAPKAVICGSCYLNPAHDGQCLTGATFDLHDASPALSPASHQENLAQLEANLPGIWQGDTPEPHSLEGRVAFRCTTFDYQPAVGALTSRSGEELEGMDLFTGLGSKGLAYAPLLAEYLADRITGQPQALPRSVSLRLEPARCRTQEQKKIA